MGSDPESASASFDFRRADHGRGEDNSLLWRLRRPVVPAAKQLIRSFGTATAASRVLPSYLLIGAKRGGSTTLARSLTASPGVQGLFPAREQLKGPYYFDVNYSKGESWYRSHFPTRRALGSDVVGEASPYYISHPHAAERAQQLVPEARIICVLRHPVERAFSHYRERVKQGVETHDSFEAAIDAESARCDGEVERMERDPSYVSWEHLNFGYVDQSRYAASLERWFEHWPREQLLVLRSEDLYADPAAVLNQTRTFLGLSELKADTPDAVQNFNRLPPATISDEVRLRVWNDVQPDVARLGELMDQPPMWSLEGPTETTMTTTPTTKRTTMTATATHSNEVNR